MLFTGVETAFVTSLVGIFCAIVYSVAHHLLMKSFRERVARLSASLDKIFPRRTAEELIAKTLAEQQLHTAALNKLGDALDKFTSGGADKVGEVFTQKVGSQMDNFSAALDRFTGAIDDKLIAALNAHAEQTKTSAANFKEAVDGQQKLLEAVTNNNVALIDKAVDNFNKAVDANRDILEQMRRMLQSSADFLRAVDASGTKLNNSADALLRATGQLLTKLPAIVEQMNKLLDSNEFTRDNLNELSAQVTAVATNFNGLAKEIEQTVTILRDALEHYNEVTDHGLQEKLRDFDKSMSAAVGYLNDLVADLTEADAVKHNQRR